MVVPLVHHPRHSLFQSNWFCFSRLPWTLIILHRASMKYPYESIIILPTPMFPSGKTAASTPIFTQLTIGLVHTLAPALCCELHYRPFAWASCQSLSKLIAAAYTPNADPSAFSQTHLLRLFQILQHSILMCTHCSRVPTSKILNMTRNVVNIIT